MSEEKIDVVLVHNAPDVVQPADETMDDLGKKLVPIAPFFDEGHLRVTSEFVK